MVVIVVVIFCHLPLVAFFSLHTCCDITSSKTRSTGTTSMYCMYVCMYTCNTSDTCCAYKISKLLARVVQRAKLTVSHTNNTYVYICECKYLCVAWSYVGLGNAKLRLYWLITFLHSLAVVVAVFKARPMQLTFQFPYILYWCYLSVECVRGKSVLLSFHFYDCDNRYEKLRYAFINTFEYMYLCC